MVVFVFVFVVAVVFVFAVVFVVLLLWWSSSSLLNCNHLDLNDYNTTVYKVLCYVLNQFQSEDDPLRSKHFATINTTQNAVALTVLLSYQ